MRTPRIPALLLPALLLIGLVGAAPAQQAASVIAAAVTDYQPALPVNAAVFYPVERQGPSRVHPTRPVDYHDVEVIRHQVDDMLYAGQQVGVYSWFGRGSFPDQVFGNHLRAADDTAFRWTLLDENEGAGKNPSVTTIRADLDSIYSRFGKDPSYFRVGGKPVLFTYGDANDTCNAAARWRTADSSNRFYLVMKVVPGFTGCGLKPASWYGYAPANGHFAAGNSFDVSPGFNKVGESGPRLGRSVARFASDLRAMKAAKVRFKLTTTWNEWMEATGVEAATEWNSASGHGAYVDQMHAILGQAPGVPAAPATLTATTAGEVVTLAWNAVPGATAYQVFRNGCQVAQVTGPLWSDTSLTDTSASYFVKAVGARGTSRRSPVRLGVAGTPAAAPVDPGGDGLVPLPGLRMLSTVTGTGVGCASPQRGQAVVGLPASAPARATAVLLSVTSLHAQGLGSVTLFGMGRPAPAVAQLRYYSSRAFTNTTLVPIGTGRQIVVQEAGAATHLYVDVVGYALPGADRPVTRQATAFYNSRSGSAAFGGTATKKVQGTVSVHLPSLVPADASAVQVRIMVSSADGPGNATVFGGGATPGVISLAYDTSVILTNSVLVPVDAARTVSFTVTRNVSVALAVEGWTVPSGHPVVIAAPVPLVSSAARHTAYDLTISNRAYWGNGHLVLLNLGVSKALGYGSLTVTPAGDPAPQLQTIDFGPQQPQSGFCWARIPANGVLHLTITPGALFSVDQLALA